MTASIEPWCGWSGPDANQSPGSVLVEELSERTVVARDELTDVGRRVLQQSRLLQLTDEAISVERAPAIAPDWRILRRLFDGRRVEIDDDQRMVRQERRVDSDRCSRLISAGDEDVELVTAKVCRLTDHVV